MKPPVNFCQVCGNEMADRDAYGKRRRVCPSCGFVHFDDPKVAVVAFIEQGNQILLIKRGVNPGRGKWALPAGYVDYGEAPDEALLREVKEETGLDIDITGLINVTGGSSADGASIVLTYSAKVTNGIARAHDDAVDVMWLSPEDVLPQLAFESTREAITRWRQRYSDMKP